MKCFTGPHSLPIPLEQPKAKDITHLWLSSWKRASTDSIPAPVTAGDMTLAAKTFPAVEALQVRVRSVDALAKISAFCNLRSLKLKFIEGGAHEHVDFVLKQLPDLEELALERCDGVMLSTITKLCPKIKTLKLLACTGSTKDVALDAGAFSNLECVEIGMQMLRYTFCSFLSVTRERLRTACFGDSGMCFEFLQYCVENGQRLRFSRLEHLTLWTSATLQGVSAGAQRSPSCAQGLARAPTPRD
ncbi:hypothetical protein MTO96_035504 [Rhipicephalus appendiculatus]